MTPQDLLRQRLLDGVLSPQEAAGVESALHSDPSLQQVQRAWADLDQGLHALARPMTSEEHHTLLTRIVERLPASTPVASPAMRATDLLLAGSVLFLIALCVTAAGSIMRSSPLLLAMACLGVVGGMLMLVLAAMLRRAEGGLLRRLLGHSVVMGPADLLVCRTIGIGMALGGIYLIHLQ